MSALPDIKAVINQWLTKADHDLKTIELLFEKKDQAPFDVACFHAQQGVEKYLKAYLVFLDIDFPKTHDLTELARLLPPSKKTLFSIDDLVALSPYAIDSRYPGDENMESEEEARAALSIARKIKDVVLKEINK